MMTPPATAFKEAPKQRQIGFDELYQQIKPGLEALTALMQEQAEDFEPEIRELVTYTLENSGKRLRPMLLFFSGLGESSKASLELVKAAAVVEMVHIATLVHDDILDDASLRHRKKTVAQKYGTAVAVLLGDALFAHALKLATEFSTVEVCRVVASATQRVCSGEISQTLRRGSPELSRASYFRIIEMKTAELFEASCVLGADIGENNPAYTRGAGAFGKHLGIAYQIFDDLTDLFGTEEKIGKTLGTDLASGKVTLPMLAMKDALGDEAFNELFLKARNGDKAAISEFFAQLRTEAVKSEVIDAFNEQLDLARKAIAPFSDQPAHARLSMLCDFVSQQLAATIA